MAKELIGVDDTQGLQRLVEEIHELSSVLPESEVPPVITVSERTVMGWLKKTDPARGKSGRPKKRK